jgi:D-alanine--poly(phosphoribitol) ligase subunit 2
MSSPEEILNLLSAVTETDEVKTNPDLRLFDLQILDSMGTVELLVALSRDLGVEVQLAEIDRERWATPREFLNDILGRTAAMH